MDDDTTSAAARPRRGHWRLIGKILISLIGFFAAFGISQLVPQKQTAEMLWSIGGSLFVAGVIFLAQYLFDVEHRMEAVEHTFDVHVARTGERLDEHARVSERQMQDGLSKIHLAGELFDLRETSQVTPYEMEQMITLVRSFTAIVSGSSLLVRRFAQGEVARLAEYLKHLGDGGDVTYDGEDRDWLLGLTRAVEYSLQATSLSTVDAGGRSFTDGGLWFSELGQAYLEDQARAIERGVRIQRIFVIDRQGFALEDLHDVLEPHVRIGVEVRTLDAKPAPGIHSRLRDLIIFDNVLSYQSTAGQPVTGLSPIIVATTLVTSPGKVSRRQREFGQLWNHENVNIVTMGECNRLVFTPAHPAPAAHPAHPVPPAQPAQNAHGALPAPAALPVNGGRLAPSAAGEGVLYPVDD
jgi:hypothetical protein